MPVEPGESETEAGLNEIVRPVAEAGTVLDIASLLVSPRLWRVIVEVAVDPASIEPGETELAVMVKSGVMVKEIVMG